MSEDLSVISENLKTLEIRTLNTSEKIKDFNISNAVPGDIIGYSGNSWVPVKSDNINTTSVDNTNVNEKIYASFDINSQTGPSTSGLDKYVNNFENLAASPVEINTSVNTPIEPITFTSDGVYLIIVNVALVYYVTGGDVEIISKIIKKNNNVETTLSTISVVSLGDTSAGGALPSSNISNYDFRTYILSGNNILDANGNVIFTSVGTGSISFSTSDGVFTSAANQYIDKSGALPSIPSGNFSIEFYMRFHTTPSDYHWNIVYTNNSDVKIIQYLRANGHFYFEIHPSSNFAATRIMYYDPFNGNWDTVNFNHFVFTYDGTGRFYYNGTLITGSIQTGFGNSVVLGSNVSFDTLYLGGGGYSARAGFGDKIEDTLKFHRMYDGVLLQNDVDYLFDNRDSILSTSPASATSFSSLITHHTVNKFTQGEKLSFKLHCIQDTGTLDSSEITNGTVTVQKLD